MDKKRRTAILLSFIAYYIIICAERCFSLIMSFRKYRLEIFSFNNKINFYSYVITLAALGLFAIYLIYAVICLANGGLDEDYQKLCVAAGILLMASMARTEYSLPWVQVVGYVCLNIGLIVMLLINVENDVKLFPFLSFIFMLGFSMSIPPVIKLNIENRLARVGFTILEVAGSNMMIFFYTKMMVHLSRDEPEAITNPGFFITMVGVVCSINAILWGEGEINWFGVFAALVGVLFFMFSFLFKEENI